MTRITDMPATSKCIQGRKVVEGLGYRVVMDLAQPYLEEYHHLYFDNFFTSVALMERLLTMKTYACATLRLNRVGLPPEIRKCKLKKKGQTMVRQKGNLVATVWYDKRQVATLSTNCNSSTPEDGGKPAVIQTYNKWMGGVDLCDQNRSYYPTGRDSKKWWRYLFWYLIDLCILNAFILYKAAPGVKRKKNYSQLDFRLDVEAGLRAGFSSRKHRIGRTPLKRHVHLDNAGANNLSAHVSRENARQEARLQSLR